MTSQTDGDLQKMEAKGTTLFDRTFRDSEGNIVIIQMPPNLPVLVGIGATILQFVLPSGKLQTGADLIAYGALFTWAWLELFEGVNYFRRALGLVALVTLVTLKLRLY